MGQMMGERGIGRESHHWNTARAATIFFVLLQVVLG